MTLGFEQKEIMKFYSMITKTKPAANTIFFVELWDTILGVGSVLVSLPSL
jgi:hypothetical protein